LTPNISSGTKQQELTALARRIRDEHQATQRAFANALAHALNVGDALIEAQTRVATGWSRWLRENCLMGKSTARLFIQLACHHTEIEAEISRVPGLSLRAARRLIAKPKATTMKPAAAPLVPTTISTMKPAADTSATAVAHVVPSGRPKVAGRLADVFERLDPEDRTDELKLLFDEVALTDVLAAMPASWKTLIEDRVLGSWKRFPDRKVQAAIQTIQRAIASDRLRCMEPAGSA
jgi:hypothetical protein